MSCISLAVRLVLWFSKVQFLKRLADRVDYYERSEVCMFSFAKQGNGFRARPVGGNAIALRRRPKKSCHFE